MKPLPHTLNTIRKPLPFLSEEEFDKWQLNSHLSAISIIKDYLNGKICMGQNISYQMNDEACKRAIEVTLPFLYKEVNRLKSK